LESGPVIPKDLLECSLINPFHDDPQTPSRTTITYRGQPFQGDLEVRSPRIYWGRPMRPQSLKQRSKAPGEAGISSRV
jgi:hypothetical protein